MPFSRLFLALAVMVVVACLVVAAVFGPGSHRFWTDPQHIPGGYQGDQVFYSWAIEKGQHAADLEDYLLACRWSSGGCTSLRTVPHEWLTYYTLGKLARLLGLTSAQALSLWYVASTVLNLTAVSAFLFAVS